MFLLIKLFFLKEKFGWQAYKSHVLGLLVQYGRRGFLQGKIELKFTTASEIPKGQGGTIYVPGSGLTFRDKAILSFSETIQSINNELIWKTYRYHYQRTSGYYFTYEKESTTDVIRKPEHHLHVLLPFPHFNSASMNLENVLKLIEVNFYSNNTKLVGRSIYIESL
ncbi:hypothetical protein FJZ31_23855 [Candidatus Poribacteria bacterium]|nr:hypothetical protein [Candidatus Poribacteria bacterium]